MAFQEMELAAILWRLPLTKWKSLMDRFAAMSVFVAAVTAGSLSAASRQLRMPLPTVSRKVAELEASLDAKLLVRGTRRLALTDVGEAGGFSRNWRKPSAAYRANTRRRRANWSLRRR